MHYTPLTIHWESTEFIRMWRPHYPPITKGEIKGCIFLTWEREPPTRKKEADESSLP